MEPTDPLDPAPLSPAAQTSDSDLERSSLLSQEPTYTNDSLSVVSSSQEPGVDNIEGHDDEDPVVVCGLAVRFPGDASSEGDFWKMMLEKRCASGEFPRERVNIDGFYQKDSSKSNTVSIKLFGTVAASFMLVYSLHGDISYHCEEATSSKRTQPSSTPTSSPSLRPRRRRWTRCRDGY
jgi:hypothetical protein